ncbi:MAG TPA: hypothetical protein VMI54_01965 [Polyangiaceae bacterium]|nr:hypothetical protein [Polyangiaceae bacterium]
MIDIDDFVLSALEASVFVSPRDHGLTPDELIEVGQRLGFRPGELKDAIARAQRNAPWEPKLRLRESNPTRLSADFNFPQSPDLRDLQAFEFVRTELIQMAREFGESSAQLPRDNLVELGAARGLERRSVEVAITVTVLDGIMQERDGIVSHATNRLKWVLPSAQYGSTRRERPFERPWLTKSYPIVQDVIARRSDGRPLNANPLDAFESLLGTLGHDRFRAWWVQTRAELRALSPVQQPAAVTVLSASLAEAALTFIVTRAKAAGLMRRIDAEAARTWRFSDLVGGAKSGDPSVRAILDERTAARCLDLNQARQRIHAGFLIDEVPTGPIPDLKPEQAREALQTLDALVRKVIEWLEAGKGAS